MRATIIANTDNPGEVDEAENWLAHWRSRLAYLSEDEGCGCCVHIWNVEGPTEVILTIPARLKSQSDWSRDGNAPTQ